jgi:hypothetical protein
MTRLIFHAWLKVVCCNLTVAVMNHDGFSRMRYGVPLSELIHNAGIHVVKDE